MDNIDPAAELIPPTVEETPTTTQPELSEDPPELQSQPSTPPEPQQLPEPAKPKRSKKTVIIVLLVLLLAGGAAGYWYWHKRPNQVKTNLKNNVVPGKDISFSPRFDSVSDYASFKDADWYAVTGGVVKIPAKGTASFYTQREGIPWGTPTGFAVHNNKLWLSTQDGIATLKDDGSGFEEMTVQGLISTSENTIRNGRVFNDKYSNKLYLNDFEKFYTFNDTSSKWEQVVTNNPSIPNRIYLRGFNKDFLVVATSRDDNPVWIYNKKTGNWKLNKPATIDDQTAQTFTINDQLFILGRTKGYTSCDGVGKVTATSIYRLDGEGNWQPLTEFNKDIKRPEIVLDLRVKNPNVTAYTFPCGDKPSTRYDVEFSNNTINLTHPTTLASSDLSSSENDVEQQALIDVISKATGLYPFTQVLAVDKKDNLIFGYSTTHEISSTAIYSKIAIAKGADVQSAATVKIPNLKDYSKVVPIMCNGSFDYLFVGIEESYEGPTGNWTEARILKMNGTAATDFVDLKNDLAAARFACSGDKITWMGKQTVQQLNLATKQVTAIGQKVAIDLNNYSGVFYPLDNGDAWMLVREAENKEDSPWLLYYIDIAKGSVQKLASKIVGSQVAISTANSTKAWVVTNGSKNNYQKLMVYDRQGASVFSKEYVSPLLIAAPSDNNVLLFTGLNTYESVFKRFKVSSLELNGTETSLPMDKVAIRSLYEVNEQTAVVDSARKQVWVTDSEFGLFTVPLP